MQINNVALPFDVEVALADRHHLVGSCGQRGERELLCDRGRLGQVLGLHLTEGHEVAVFVDDGGTHVEDILTAGAVGVLHAERLGFIVEGPRTCCQI